MKFIFLKARLSFNLLQKLIEEFTPKTLSFECIKDLKSNINPRTARDEDSLRGFNEIITKKIKKRQIKNGKY